MAAAVVARPARSRDRGVSSTTGYVSLHCNEHATRYRLQELPDAKWVEVSPGSCCDLHCTVPSSSILTVAAQLRRASFISPTTGERSRRTFTLREASNRLDSRSSERIPLLRPGHDEPPSTIRRFGQQAHGHWNDAITFLNSKNGRGILKCSLAYLLGSLVTFVPALAAIIGDSQDSKHMVATVTVWFHPSRTIGSMHMAAVLATYGFCFAGFMGFTSMGISQFFGDRDLLVVGHVIVLIFFVGAGLGSIAWTKQHFGDPLVNVACSLASLGCISVLIKEGAVQAGAFSDDRVAQILLMVIMGVIVATAVNAIVLPTTARSQLRDDMEKATDTLGELLISITRAFLSGRKDDLQDDFYTKLQKEHQQAQQKMSKDLNEARNELLVQGKEKLYHVSARLVDCMDGLSQDIGALRSAALAQFALVESNPSANGHDSTTPASPEDRRPSWYNTTTNPPPTDAGQGPSILDVITEMPDEAENGDLSATPPNRPLPNGAGKDPSISSTLGTPPDRKASVESLSLESPNDMFFTFIAQLGPPTKSLVYTLKQILDELPFKEPSEPQSIWESWLGSNVEVAINNTLHSSLEQAVDLYRTSRKQALEKLYASRALSAAFSPQGGRKAGAFSGRTLSVKPGQNGVASPPRHPKPQHERPSEDVLADIEEVSACCGHFSFSLLDFAEDMLEYLNHLEDLKQELENSQRSWKWLVFWRRSSWRDERPQKFGHGTDFEHGDELGASHDIPEPIKKADTFGDPEKRRENSLPWYYRVYGHLSPLRRDDVKFAIKVGIGAILYALPAFLPSTRPFFVHWRGEWGLISYMVVCCMTVGAANTTGLNRFIGTFIGACLAIIAWILSATNGDANPYLLAFFGWCVANACFYLILAKGQGPMGRFILLTYNLGALYAYSLSVGDPDDDDEGGIDPAIWEIVLHRVVAVIVGCIWGIIVSRMIWPISARKKIANGLCILWLRMSLVWKRDPLAMFLLGEPKSHYMDIREESSLQSFLSYLDSLRSAAGSEFELRGPFPDDAYARIIERTRRMLDAFHAMNVIITKNPSCSKGEAAVLRYTREQRFALSARISHLFSVLASSFKLEYPLNDVLPSIEHSRDALLARISEFRRQGEGREEAVEGDFEVLYAYVLVTGQLAGDIEAVSKEIEGLFGVLDEENLKLQ